MKFLHSPLMVILAVLVAFNASLPAQDLIPYRDKAGKWGFCDKEKQIIVPPQYETVVGYGGVEPYLPVQRNGKWGAVNRNGKEIVRPIYDSLTVHGDTFIALRKNGKWGYWSREFMDEFIYPVYDEAREFVLSRNQKAGTRAFVAVVRLGNKWGVVDGDGMERVPPKYDQLDDFQQENNIGKSAVARFKSGSKWGIIDEAGAEVIPAEYDFIDSLRRNSMQYFRPSRIQQKKQWGFLNLQVLRKEYGKDDSNIESLRYDSIDPDIKFYYASSALVQRQSLWGIVYSGKETVPPRYDEIINDWACRFANVRRGKHWGLVHIPSGKELLPPNYDTLVNHGYEITVKKDGKWGMYDNPIDRLRNTDDRDSIIYPREMLPFVYDALKEFGEDSITACKREGKWGMVSKSGIMVIPAIYDSIGREERGLWQMLPLSEQEEWRLCVKMNGKWGVIDSLRREVIPPLYDQEFQFFPVSKKLYAAAVQRGEKWGIINPAGETMIAHQYDSVIIPDIDSPLLPLLVQKQGRWGIIDSANGRLLETISAQYEEWKQVSDILYSVRKQGKWRLVNRQGKEISAPSGYDEIKKFQNNVALIRLGNESGYVSLDGTEYWEGGYTAPQIQQQSTTAKGQKK